MFKKLAVSVIVSAIILIPMTVKAEWVVVDESSKSILSVGKKIILLDNKPTFFWQKFTYKKPQSDGVEEVVTYNEIDCDSIASKIHRIIAYNHNGEVIEQKETKEILDWVHPIPDSVGENILNSICN